MWNSLVRELWWCDRTHRHWMRVAAVAFVRHDDITNYFRRRKEELKEAGEDPAFAYLTEEGKRNPLAVELLAVEESVRKSLASLGASPAAQMRILSDAGESMPQVIDPDDNMRFIA